MSHQELASLHPIELRINCVGGDVYVAQGIIAKINELRRAGRKVNGHVVGYAWSAAFDILQACDYRTMESGASLMTHEEHMLPEGLLSSSEMGGIAAFSHKMERFAFAQWSKRTGRPVSYYVKQTKNREWWMSAEEALGEAFVDAVLPVPPFAENLATAPMKRTRPAADTDEDED
jgi:ATP-dependent protease ClpP protease subunit